MSVHVEVDVTSYSDAPNSPVLKCLKRHATLLFGSSFATMICWLIFMIIMAVSTDDPNTHYFWIFIVIKFVILFLLQYILGCGVLYYNWHVGYTRKVVHVGFFLLPFLFDLYVPMPSTKKWLWALWNVHIICWMLFGLTKPIRSRIPMIQIMYAAVDRPEDRGLTQVYTIVQVPLSICVIAIASVLLDTVWNVPRWTLCPIIAVTFGDGLAEPVAVFWERNKCCGGTHRYETTGCCSGGRKYTRSIEGSAVVFIWTIASVLMIEPETSGKQCAFLLSILPITMTCLEMYAPHSMDNPFLLAWGYVVLICARFV